MAKLRVAVLFGGRSGEHEISIRSAASVVTSLDRSRYDVIPIAIAKSGKWLTPAESQALLPEDSRDGLAVSGEATLSREPGASRGFDVVFPVLHGTYGEDGTVQGLLELADIAYVGSGVLGSACGMDKDVMKRLFRESGLPTVPHVTLLRREIETRGGEALERFGYPLFVKPANLGSSVGISRAANDEEYARALAEAARFDRKLIVEPGIDGREIEVAVLGNDEPEASIAGEIIPGDAFYSYEEKYLTTSTELCIPAELSEEDQAEVRRLAVAAFKAVELSGLARVDFFLEKSSGRFLLNEVNTMPGFTSISMYPKLWEATGLPYRKLTDRLIALALERRDERRATRFEL